MKAKISLAVVVILLCSCGLVQPTPEEMRTAYYGPYPANYQDLVKDYMRYKLYDPMSAIYDFTHPPQQGWMSHVGKISYGWVVVCMINSKNLQGGYVGFEREVFLISDGRVIGYNYRAGLR